MCKLYKNLIKKIFLIFFTSIVIFGVYTKFVSGYKSELGIEKPENEYYNLLVKGFVSGHLYLNIKAPNGLQKLDDPYDPNQNAIYRGAMYSQEPPRLHDLSYYKGKLYLYFSAVPALILFLPYHLITNTYLSQVAAILIFLGVGFISLSVLIIDIRDKYFYYSSKYIVVGVLLGVGFGGGIIKVLCRPDVWEVPIISGYALMIFSICMTYHGLSSRCNNKAFIFIANLSCLLSVLSRPNLIFDYIVIFIIFSLIIGFNIKRLLMLVIPCATLFLLCLAYNYERFDSVLEFGQHYQLAADRQSGVHFDINYLIYNLYLYFASIPEYLSNNFFQVSNYLPELPKGHAEIDSYTSVIVSMPITLFAFSIPFTFRLNAVDSHFKKILILLSIVFLINTFVSCLYYGTCIRYELDFAPYLFILSGIGSIILDNTLNDQRLYRLIFRIIFTLLLAISIFTNWLTAEHWKAKQLFNHARTDLYTNNTKEAKQLLDLVQNLDSRSKKDYEFQNTYGIALYQSGDLKNAEVALRYAANNKPDDINILCNLALVLIYNGKKQEAKSILYNILVINPKYEEAYKLLNLLR